MWWNSEKVWVEQCDSGAVIVEEYGRWNSGTVMVEQCGGTVEQCWWNSGAVTWKSGAVLVEQCDSGAVIVEQCGWWNCGTVMVEQWNSVGGIV